MIDLHCHLLPALDDGAASLDVALAMARMAVADGVTSVVCTPHIYPGVFYTERAEIRRRVELLARALAEHEIPLQVTHGAEIHMVPELLQRLREGRMATLNDSRYVLLEPQQFVAPQRFAQAIEGALAIGYVPIIAHPERLDWLDATHYSWFVDAVYDGAWIQLTADALVGRFGPEAKRWSELFLADGLVHVLASDGHDEQRRPPVLSGGVRVAEHWVGSAEAERLVLDRPRAVLANADPLSVVPPPGVAEQDESEIAVVPERTSGSKGGFLRRLLQGRSDPD
jgi:protein-tyrosine phosphatase